MKPGEGIPDDLGDGRDLGIVVVRVGPAKSDKSVHHLAMIRGPEIGAEFLRDRAGDIGTADLHRPDEKLPALHENHVRGAGTDVDQKSGVFNIRVIETQRVVERRRGKLRAIRFETGTDNEVVDLGQFIRFDGGKGDFHFDVAGFAHQLIPPDDLIDGIRHLLLGFKLHDLIHPGTVQSGQARELHQNREGGDHVVGLDALDLQRIDQLLERLGGLGIPRPVFRRVTDKVAALHLFQTQPTPSRFREQSPGHLL